ncbi:large ribosomal subunit protein P1-like [Cavia porcellus]|uniref:large ribosomal subunit protein P1-like n=1 Tax=Cavia porcellus TaxID=10141 RepID=UPI000184FA35
MTSVSKLTCIYSALILHHDEQTEDKINALIKVASFTVESFWPGLFAKTLNNVNSGSLIYNVGAGGPAPAAMLYLLEAPSTAAAPAEKVEAKKDESEECDINATGFGLFH